MMKRGRTAIALTDFQQQIVEEYLTNDKGYQETADRYGVKKSSLQYWTKKYRQLCKEVQMNESSDGGQKESDQKAISAGAVY